jgi:hypothetical protein
VHMMTALAIQDGVNYQSELLILQERVQANITDVMQSPVKKILQGHEASKWQAAMDKEMETLFEMGVYQVVDRTPEMRVLPSKFILAKKYLPDGTLEKFKARLTAGGHRERANIDYCPEDVFAPVMGLAPLRLLLAYGMDGEREGDENR